MNSWVFLTLLLFTLPLTGSEGEEKSPSTIEHWAFESITRTSSGTHEGRNPIDGFLLVKARQAGIADFAERASQRVLLRRVSFTLTGLPPLVEDAQRFSRQDHPNAYEQEVDRLLASPAYGERWAQHWLDVARFAESDGFEFDHERKEAWRFRDWVMRSLNADLPYDQFVQHQIAGDLLEPTNERTAEATGFLLAGPDMVDINLPEERRHNVLNEMTSTVGSAFMGLTIGCAQCHDHRTDPITITDFYSLRAFFANTVTNPKRSKQLGHRVREPSTQPPSSFVRTRGDFRLQGEAVSPRFPAFLTPQVAYTGGRIALSQWLTDPGTSFVPRVMVNRLWQHHFGMGLVGTPNDFGQLGNRPTHPQLLDWLAADLTDHDWSLKHLHRLLVTSQTFAQSSQGTGQAWVERLKADPLNHLRMRASRQRLSGEAMRDAMLRATDHLNRKGGGPGIRPSLPKEVKSTLLKNQWEVTPDETEHHRRSLYLFVRRNLRFPMFDVFDRPDTNASCAKRSVSTTAPQSLTLLNSNFSYSAAERLAKLARLSNDPIQEIYQRVYSRPPSPEERTLSQKFLKSQTHQITGLTDLSLALFNTNEALYID